MKNNLGCLMPIQDRTLQNMADGKALSELYEQADAVISSTDQAVASKDSQDEQDFVQIQHDAMQTMAKLAEKARRISRSADDLVRIWVVAINEANGPSYFYFVGTKQAIKMRLRPLEEY